MGRTVLVTGERGFVGGHVLAQAGARGLDAFGAGCDLREPEPVRARVAETKPFAVLHLASARRRAGADVWRALSDDLLMAGNVLGAVAALAPDAVVLVPGSAAEYGLGGTELLGEEVPISPVSVYGETKALLEAACTSPLMRGRVRVIWTRSFNHVGPGQGLDAPVPSWARQIAEAEVAGSGVVRTGSLDSVRDFLDVRDVADAYLELVVGTAEGVVNVCSGRGRRLAEVAEALAALSRVPVPIERDPTLERDVDPPFVVGDPRRLHELTGWSPSVELEQSLRAVLEEWRARVSERNSDAVGAPRA